MWSIRNNLKNVNVRNYFEYKYKNRIRTFIFQENTRKIIFKRNLSQITRHRLLICSFFILKDKHMYMYTALKKKKNITCR